MSNPSQTPVITKEAERPSSFEPRVPSPSEQQAVDEVIMHLAQVETRGREAVPGTDLQEVPLPHEALDVPESLRPHLTSVPEGGVPEIPPLSALIATPSAKERVKRGLKKPVSFAYRWLAEKCLKLLKTVNRIKHRGR